MFTGGWKELDAAGLSGLGWASDGFAESPAVESGTYVVREVLGK